MIVKSSAGYPHSRRKGWAAERRRNFCQPVRQKQFQSEQSEEKNHLSQDKRNYPFQMREDDMMPETMGCATTKKLLLIAKAGNQTECDRMRKKWRFRPHKHEIMSNRRGMYKNADFKKQLREILSSMRGMRKNCFRASQMPDMIGCTTRIFSNLPARYHG